MRCVDDEEDERLVGGRVVTDSGEHEGEKSLGLGGGCESTQASNDRSAAYSWEARALLTV